MKKVIVQQCSDLKSVELYEGETIEEKIRRITENKEPITDSAPITFTERKDGVIAAYDIRTDRWDIALDAMDKVNTARNKSYAKEEDGNTDTETKVEEAAAGNAAEATKVVKNEG